MARTKHRILLAGIPLTLLSLLLFFEPAVLAQNPPPPGDNSGSQAQRFRRESEEAEKTLKGEPSRPAIEMPEEKAEAPAEEEVTFVLKQVRVTGTTLYPPGTFEQASAPLLGKDVTLADLDRVMQKIKERYGKDGYMTANVYLPEQDIVAGDIEIRVLEGRMGDLRTEGNRWRSRRSLERYVHIKKNETLNLRLLQKDLLRLNNQGDLEARTVLAPGKETGATDVVLKVTDKFPWHVGASIDNQGSRLTGKTRYGVTARSSNVTGRGDSFFSNSVMTDYSVSEYAHYEIPLTSRGLAAGFDYTLSRNILGKEYRSGKIEGTTQFFHYYFSQELYLSEKLEIEAATGMDIRRSLRTADDEMTSHDELRILYGSTEFVLNDRFGRTVFKPTVSFSTAGFLGASHRGHPSASRDGTGGFFFKYEQALTRIQRMPFGSYAMIRSQFQFPTHTLPSSEQFQLGGFYTVRGYPEGDFMSDWGFSFGFDWILQAYGLPRSWKLPFAKVPLRNQLEPVIFTDLGYGKVKKAQPGERGETF
ncbi:MAG: ShlB/FhaC/HecB family hemolysin secretion/activation protein, partial [Candidatus Omnitrophota bacterium]